MALLTIMILFCGFLIGCYIIANCRHRRVTTARVKEPDCLNCNAPTPQCEQLCMINAAAKDVEYYDDEELDRYRGRPADAYSDSEAEEFYEVMTTMRPEEVAGWSLSLTLRGVNVPDQIKDELIMLIDR